MMKKWVHSKRRSDWRKVNSCRRVVTLNGREQLVSGDSHVTTLQEDGAKAEEKMFVQ